MLALTWPRFVLDTTQLRFTFSFQAISYFVNTQICANQGWDDTVARVACRQLGFDDGTALQLNLTRTSAAFRPTSRGQGEYARLRGINGRIVRYRGQGSRGDRPSKFTCTGQESSLDQCRLDRNSYNIIGRCRPAIVRCNVKKFNTVKIQNGESLMGDKTESDSWFICQRRDEMPFV